MSDYKERQEIKKYAVIDRCDADQITHWYTPDESNEPLRSYGLEHNESVSDDLNEMIELGKQRAKKHSQAMIVVEVKAVISPVSAEPTIKEIV